jgi:hypothetical protein
MAGLVARLDPAAIYALLAEVRQDADTRENPRIKSADEHDAGRESITSERGYTITRPARIAIATASTRLRAPSFSVSEAT